MIEDVDPPFEEEWGIAYNQSLMGSFLSKEMMIGLEVWTKPIESARQDAEAGCSAWRRGNRPFPTETDK